MNKRELVAVVAAHTEYDKRVVQEILEGFQEVVGHVVSKGEPITWTGFVKFVKVDRPARMARNPATGEPVRVKASKKVRVTPLKALKEMVINPRLAPKLARGIWTPQS